MRLLPELFERNQRWAEEVRRRDPEFFAELARQQAPPYLWIGCSDSRVPANQITGLQPGEMFVHRNVANVVAHGDLNCLSVLHFAVQVLKVHHVIVCGHYGCGGVRAALEGKPVGLVDHWLRFVRDVAREHRDELDGLPDLDARVDRLCELNVRAQARHVAESPVVQEAWRRGEEVAVHGWIYALHDGRLRDLGVCFTAADQVPDPYGLRDGGGA